MTTGALIFAYNNEVTDYVAMAEWSAKNIKRHLGIPTHIVTGDAPAGNTRHFSDYGINVTWYNQTRTDAYSLTPWDTTLVLDADYIVASNALDVLFHANQDFICHRLAYDVTHLNNFDTLNVFGQYNMPMWWATVMLFRKSAKAEYIFNSMQMVRDNWEHYRNLYVNTKTTYRNDHALSIALNIENGHTLQTTDIPWGLASLTPDHKLTQLGEDYYRIDYIDANNKPRWITLRNQDFHAMGKQQLGDLIAGNA